MSGENIGIGFAGCGASVQMYGPALHCLEGVEVVAWMDPVYEKAKLAAERYGGEAYLDYGKFLAHDGLDAVVITSPVRMHLPQAKQAAEFGKPVLCEKPMAGTVKECKAIINAAEGAGQILMVGFMKRFSPYFKKVKQMIVEGEIGELFEIKTDWSWPQYFLAGWRDKREQGGGLFLDHGSHTIDLCRWWAGDIKSVYADIRILFDGREVEDYAQAVFHHQSGCISTHYNSRMTHRPLRECYTIEGRKCTVTLECLDKWSFDSLEPFVIKKYTLGKVEQIPLAHLLNIEDHFENTWMYLGSLKYFIECVKGNKKPEFCSGKDGLAAVEAINASYLSAYEKRVIALPLTKEYNL